MCIVAVASLGLLVICLDKLGSVDELPAIGVYVEECPHDHHTPEQDVHHLPQEISYTHT